MSGAVTITISATTLRQANIALGVCAMSAREAAIKHAHHPERCIGARDRAARTQKAFDELTAVTQQVQS